MPWQEEKLLNNKDFSEIDYFFSSNLATSSWGVDRLLQRVILFDPLKRHIPYLLLIHIIFYNTDLEHSLKKEILNKLIDELYKKIIKKAIDQKPACGSLNEINHFNNIGG